MGCEYYRELISAEADGEVTEAERAALRTHLAACEDCRRYAAALQAISEGLAEEAEAPAHFAESVMAKLPAKKKNVIPLRRWGSLAAAAVLVIALSAVGGRVFAPKGGAAAVPAAGADMAAPAAAAPEAPAAEEQKNEPMMFAAPRMEEAPEAEYAVTESAAAAVDPREEAALHYAREKLPGHWEILSVEDDTVLLRHESGEELNLTVDENGEVRE